MAHFYSTAQGNRGEVTRTGSKNSGLRTVAASWQGAVETNLYHENGVDMVSVHLRTWHGAGTDVLLYRGPVSGRMEFLSREEAQGWLESGNAPEGVEFKWSGLTVEVV